MRQYDVTFSNTFFVDLPPPFPPGFDDTRLVFTSIESITPRAGLTGDYNNDGQVDAADYVMWRKTNINGVQGYADWRTNFGAMLMPGGGSAAPVPEPVSLSLLGLVCLAFSSFASRRRNSHVRI